MELQRLGAMVPGMVQVAPNASCCGQPLASSKPGDIIAPSCRIPPRSPLDTDDGASSSRPMSDADGLPILQVRGAAPAAAAIVAERLRLALEAGGKRTMQRRV